MTYEDKDYFSAADNPEEVLTRKEAAKQRKAMLSQLTPVQRRRIIEKQIYIKIISIYI